MDVLISENCFIRYSLSKEPLGDIWIIHGFAESGLSFQNTLTSELASAYNIFLPDIPGFGASPFQQRLRTIDDYIDFLKIIIQTNSKATKRWIIGHSFGSVMAMVLVEKMAFAGFISVEGNLTDADSYFSGWAGTYSDGQKFKKDFKSLLLRKAESRKEFENYFVSASLAHPDALIVLGKASRNLTKDTSAATRYLSVECPKLYLWGNIDTPLSTQKFINEIGIDHRLFNGAGHWLMQDTPKEFYQTCKEFIEQTK